jgi:hypothetical protein
MNLESLFHQYSHFNSDIIMYWTKESLKSLCQLDAPNFRKTVAETYIKALKNVPLEKVLQPAKVTNTIFKGPQSHIPVRIYTPESK